MAQMQVPFLNSVQSLGDDETIKMVIVGNLLIGVSLGAFDLLRKTVFRGAAWNFNYPYWNYVYNIEVYVLLAVALAIPILLYGRLIKLDRSRYLLSLYVISASFLTLTYFALPVEAYLMSLTPADQTISHDFLYHPAVVLVEEGPSAYFSTFHTLPTLNGANRFERAAQVSDIVGDWTIIPFNMQLSEYIGDIYTTRHGPVPPLIIAPFLILLGTTPAAAVFGTYSIVSFLPILGYFAFNTYFGEQTSRIGSLFVVYMPALYIFVRHKTIPYDSLTAVLVALTTYAILRGLRNRSTSWIGGGGVLLSLSLFSKLMILPIVGSYVLSIVYSADKKLKKTILLVLPTLILTLALIPLGYNHVAQFLYDFLGTFAVSSGSIPSSDPASYLNSPIVAHLSALYNVRLMGPPVLLLSLLSVQALREDPVEHGVIGLLFVTAAVPFLVFSGLTLSRHLLPLIVPIVFSSLFAIERYRMDGQFVRSSLAVLSVLLLVNL